MILKKSLLILSFFTITTIALLYGISPQWFFDSFLVTPEILTVDQSHILRAVMGLYIALGFFWLYAAFNNKFRDAGILVLAIFCGGLVSGRIISVIIDGFPSDIMIVYIFMELTLVPICIWLLRQED